MLQRAVERRGRRRVIDRPQVDEVVTVGIGPHIVFRDGRIGRDRRRGNPVVDEIGFLRRGIDTSQWPQTNQLQAKQVFEILDFGAAKAFLRELGDQAALGQQIQPLFIGFGQADAHVLGVGIVEQHQRTRFIIAQCDRDGAIALVCHNRSSVRRGIIRIKRRGVIHALIAPVAVVVVVLAFVEQPKGAQQGEPQKNQYCTHARPHPTKPTVTGQP